MQPQSNEINPIELMFKFGWTQQRLAEEMDWSVSAVAKWSCGVRKPSKRARVEAYKVLAKHANF